MRQMRRWGKVNLSAEQTDFAGNISAQKKVDNAFDL